MKKVNKVQTLSYIETEEEAEARKLIEEQLGFPAPRVTGYHIVVKIYVRQEDIHSFTDENTGEVKSIYLPEIVTGKDKFTSCSALVIAVGPHAYTGRRFEEHWFIRFCRLFFNKWMNPNRKFPWCKVGDKVHFARYGAMRINVKDHEDFEFWIIMDKDVLCVEET